MKTLADAQQFLNVNCNKGTHCPCCNQFVKVYKRKLNSGMAISLIDIYKMHLNVGIASWLQVNKELTDIGKIAYPAYASLHYWGLLEAKNNILNPAKKHSGLWKITPLGIEFVKNQTTVQKYAILYNKKLLKLDGIDINIKDALGSKFNYTQLMTP